MAGLPFESIPDDKLMRDLSEPFPLQSVEKSDGSVELSPSQYSYYLVNPTLPINEKRDAIVDTMWSGRSFIVQSPTGSGKTLELPKIALELSEYSDIYVTQPTILAARLVGERLAAELSGLGADGSKLVGYQTATEGNVTDKTRIRIVTDQLLAQAAMKNALGEKPLVILDEFHMRKVGTDVAFSLCAARGIQTVISSATIDTKFIARRGAEILDNDMPIITGKGRRFPVETIRTDMLASEATVEMVKRLRYEEGIQDPKIAVFVSGDKDIRVQKGLIKRRIPKDVAIYRLTGESSYAAQAEAIADHPGGSVILTTNIMETSITVPNLHAVIDGGYHRIGDFDKGVKTLPLEPVSWASHDQRRGRVGRTMPGWYVESLLDGYKPASEFRRGLDNQPTQTVAYDRPEIRRIDLSSMELRLVAAGTSLNDISLITQPSRNAVEAARFSLENLGLMHYGHPSATELGEVVSDLNVDSHYGRMLAEAMRHGEVVGLQMAAAVSVAQVKGIGSTGLFKRQWKSLTKEKLSDIVAQLDIFLAALDMSESEMAQVNIVDRRFDRAKETFESLAARLNLDASKLRSPTDQERTLLRESAIKGYPTVFVRSGRRAFRGENGVRRFVTASSVLDLYDRNLKIIVGEPLDIGNMTSKGLKFRKTIKMAQQVDVETLERVSPERISYTPDGFRLNAGGLIMSVRSTFFDDIKIGSSSTTKVELNEKTDRYLVQRLFTAVYNHEKLPHLDSIYTEFFDELVGLQHRTDEDLQLEKLEDYLNGLVRMRAPSQARSIRDVTRIIQPQDIEDYIDDDTRQHILEISPSYVVLKIQGEDRAFEAGYQSGTAYLKVTALDVQHLPDDKKDSQGRRLLYRIGGNKKLLTVAEAKEHFGESSRWFKNYQRRLDESSAPDRPRSMDFNSEDLQAAHNIALEAGAVVVNHFGVKGTRRRRHRR